MIEIVSIILVVLTMAYISYPLIKKSKRSVSFELNHQAEDLAARKQAVYAAISDIEFDYKMGKLSKEDFEELRDQYKGEAIAIMQKFDDVTLAKRTSGKQPSATAEKFCRHCGHPVQAQDKFCDECGESLL